MSKQKTNRVITIKTGEDMWAIVVGEESSFIEDAAALCIGISRKIWQGQKVKVTGLDDETTNKLKKKAFEE